MTFFSLSCALCPVCAVLQFLLNVFHSYVFHFLLTPCEGMKPIRLPGKLLTLFKLDPDTGIILYLLYHLSISANDDANSKSGHNDLNEGDSEKFFSPFYLFFKKRNNIVSSLLSVIKIKLGGWGSVLHPDCFPPFSIQSLPCQL